MAYHFVSEDRLARSNDLSFIGLWNDIGRRQRSAQDAWCAEMVAKGAKIVMADDGWVNRKRHTASPPSYAFRIRKAVAGDLIALGSPENWRIVRVTGVDSGWLTQEPIYSFDPVAVEVSA
jgi:hypothetical protein